MATARVKQEVSTAYSLNFRDVVRGVLMAAIGAVVRLVLLISEQGTLQFDAATGLAMGKAAIVAACAYLIKNFFGGPEKEPG